MEKKRTFFKNGFSLIEVLVAMMILAFAVIGIMAVFPTGYRHITSAGRVSTLNHLGQMKLDQLRATSFSDLDLQAGIHPSTGCTNGAWPGEGCPQSYPQPLEYTDSTGTLYDDYTVRWTVADNTPQAGMKKVTIIVGYQEYDDAGNLVISGRAKDQRVATFTTYLTQ